ncbi:MAG: polymerase sigma factor RpoE [Labilithrix sp.]|nr:polymerase sigma factor RpoE [Labilithrix sp.]
MTPIVHDDGQLVIATVPTPREEPTASDIFREHGRYVFRLLRRLGVPDADADDVLQEVFVVVHRKLSDFDPHGSLRAWVYGICVRRAANYRKRQRGRSALPPEDAIDRAAADQTAPPEALDARKARAVLETILRGLPDQKREVFVLHVIEELSMHEVAVALECPLHTAYSRFYSARKLVDDGIRRARAQMERP